MTPGMEPEALRVRSVYLFLACSQAVEQVTERLIATFPAQPLTARVTLTRSLRRELGMLFRYWTTREIWERLEASEADAKQMNLTLLRLFTEGFRLPRDGSGLRYAELSTAAEETQELSRRLINALGMEHQPLLAELQSGVAPWRERILAYTREALALPLETITAKVKAWAERSPEAGA